MQDLPQYELIIAPQPETRKTFITISLGERRSGQIIYNASKKKRVGKPYSNSLVLLSASRVRTEFGWESKSLNFIFFNSHKRPFVSFMNGQGTAGVDRVFLHAEEFESFEIRIMF